MHNYSLFELPPLKSHIKMLFLDAFIRKTYKLHYKSYP